MRITIPACVLRLLAARAGNASVIFAIASLPILIAAGGAVDYAIASRIKTQLSAIADAAALAATTPAMMAQSSTTAASIARGMFATQVPQIKKFVYSSANLTVDVQDSTASTVKTRVVTVTYAAQVANAFGSFYYIPTTVFTVKAASTASTARNIDFYLLLDNSPSMELPATTAGLAAMSAATGCAFACHEKELADAQLNPAFVGWNKFDSYSYAQSQGIALRIDNVREAVKRIATSAQTMTAANEATYRIATYAFNFGFTQLNALLPATSANVVTINNSVGALTPPMMARENYLPAGASYAYPTSASAWTTAMIGGSDLNTRDALTDIGMALKQLNGAVGANPGSGTTAAGDKPQGVVMLVTDGLVDGSFTSNAGCSNYTKAYSNSFGSFYRCLGPISAADCQTFKDRGFRVAVLNLVYYPTPGYGFFDAAVAPFISQVAPALKSCASPDLYFEVDTKGDIAEAMLALFQKIITTASRLTQ